MRFNAGPCLLLFSLTTITTEILHQWLRFWLIAMEISRRNANSRVKLLINAAFPQFPPLPFLETTDATKTSLLKADINLARKSVPSLLCRRRIIAMCMKVPYLFTADFDWWLRFSVNRKEGHNCSPVVCNKYTVIIFALSNLGLPGNADAICVIMEGNGRFMLRQSILRFVCEYLSL